MSWGGSGSFFGPSLMAHRRATGPLPADDAALRQLARKAYTEGRLSDAQEAQNLLLARLRGTGELAADDFLFAGLIHHSIGQIDAGLAVMREALVLFPDMPALHENLGVLYLAAKDPAACIAASERAVALGSESINVHDTLADAYAQMGRTDLAVTHGRSALDLKDRRFGNGRKLAALPSAPPPAFDPTYPERNVIAYSLWGDQPRYLVPLLENARIRPHLFPEWTIRVYHDRAVDPGYLGQLAATGTQLVPMDPPPGLPAHRRLLWRFEAFADPNVSRFLIRDADSLLTVKERVAIDDWLRSGRRFHTMRDYCTHTDLLLAGLWGGVGGILPPPSALLDAFIGFRVENTHIDQDLLTETVWPIVRDDILIHDSIFQPCLGSVPFPPYGALPEGHHIGQNSFLHFVKSG